jgi:hypothetical protein
LQIHFKRRDDQPEESLQAKEKIFMTIVERKGKSTKGKQPGIPQPGQPKSKTITVHPQSYLPKDVR